MPISRALYIFKFCASKCCYLHTGKLNLSVPRYSHPCWHLRYLLFEFPLSKLPGCPLLPQNPSVAFLWTSGGINCLVNLRQEYSAQLHVWLLVWQQVLLVVIVGYWFAFPSCLSLKTSVSHVVIGFFSSRDGCKQAHSTMEMSQNSNPGILFCVPVAAGLWGWGLGAGWWLCLILVVPALLPCDGSLDVSRVWILV